MSNIRRILVKNYLLEEREEHHVVFLRYLLCLGFILHVFTFTLSWNLNLANHVTFGHALHTGFLLERRNK